MKSVASRLNITTKLALLLIIFLLIFYGTIAVVFLHTREMRTISQEIVTVNAELVTRAKTLIASLLEMDENAKKFSLLQKESYKKYFDVARDKFEGNLFVVSGLMSDDGYALGSGFQDFLEQYSRFSEDSSELQRAAMEKKSIAWVEEQALQRWLAALVDLRDTGQLQIEQSLGAIHEQAEQSVRDGVLGFTLSVIVSLLGGWFISKSIILPLKQLTRGLRSISRMDESPNIQVSSKDAFYDLACAYNDMSEELREQENLRADFIASLSHEIRTPLSSIQESVNLLVEEIMGPVNEKQRRFLLIAGEELSRIRILLEQLMHTSRLEEKPALSGRQVIDPKQLISDCVAVLMPLAKNKNIWIQVVNGTAGKKIVCRREEMQQVMLNILGNAIKFSPAQTTVTVATRLGIGEMIFQVKDQGPGVDEEERSLIFKKYYRSKAVRNHMSGVGLGLYICRKIVYDSGGRITVTNNPDRGCTFEVALPES